MTTAPDIRFDTPPKEGEPVATGALGLLRMPRVVLFGEGQRHAVGQVVAGLGRAALICTDSRLAASTELSGIVSSLEDAGVTVHVFADTEAELPVTCIIRCLAGLSGTSTDVVVGLGGGSCLDMAKMVALLLTHGGRPQDYYGEFLVPGPTLPVVAIPTTAGTGSEATPVAVLTDPDRAIKVGVSSPHLIPHTAICDPQLTHSCPAALTAATGADALTHLVEAYTAIRRVPTARLAQERVFVGKSLLTDGIAVTGLQLVGRSLLRVHQVSGDTVARQEMMMAALAGGIALGTAGTAAAHALQYPIGAITHTPHGVGVGSLLPYVMRYNFPTRLKEFAEVGRALGVASEGRDELSAARAGVEAVDALVDGLGLPRTLADLGLPSDRIDTVAELALGAQRLVENNPRPLDVAAMLAITRAAYEGDRSFPSAG